MRDALVAAINLNIFNKHCDRVKMANIAQLVNVLQAVILTKGEKMLLTPTYHVFDLYKEHQEGTLIDSYIETSSVGIEDAVVPNLHVSASQNSGGKVHVTLANLSAQNSYPVEMELSGVTAGGVSAKILTGEIHAHNDFTDIDKLKTEDFKGITRNGQSLNFVIPACSVLAVTAG
jgi:alpha-N-arabinofuranosidase